MNTLLLTTVLLFFLNIPGMPQLKWVHPQPCGNWVTSMTSTDPQHAWITATGGSVLSTRNGGESWQRDGAGMGRNLPPGV